MQKQFPLTTTPVMLVALTASMTVVADAAKAQSAPARPVTNESQLIREIVNDPLNVRAVQPVTQVTSVSQLSDVRPTDWAFTALQSLVERYNCIAGYPDRTYRGQRAMTRFEFAAGLNACLDKINEIIAAGLADKVGKDDLEAIARLQEEFAAELASLRGRVDTLEGKVATLERQQFSTTTKLQGEVIFGLIGGTDGVETPTAGTSTGDRDRTNITFSYRARLDFRTSFTGRDLLRTRLNANNTPNLNAGAAPTFGLVQGNSARVSFDGTAGNDAVNIDKLFYQFPIGDNRIWVGARIATDDVLDPLSPISSDSQGTISRFGRFNPLLRISGINSGIGADFKLSGQGNLKIFYGASDASIAGTVPGVGAPGTNRGGLFGNDSLIAAQLVWKPAPTLDLGIGYGYSSHGLNSLNSGLNADGNVLGPIQPTNPGLSANTVAGNLVWRFAPNVSFFTWGSFTFANSNIGSRSGTFTSWLAGFSFDNLINRGDRAAIFFGQPLYASSISANVTSVNGVGGSNLTAPYHLEAFYNFRVTPNLSITPGVFFVFNPNSDSRLGTATVGVIRSTFTF
jgi:hypothetical protein